MRTLGVLFAVVISVALGTSARADVLCKRRSGVLVLRDACRTSETQVDPVALGLQGSPGEPTGLGPGAIVKDANGAVVAVSTYLGLVRDLGGGRIVPIQADRDGLQPAANGLINPATGTLDPSAVSLAFTDGNCSGQAFVQLADTFPPPPPPPQPQWPSFVEYPFAVDGAKLYFWPSPFSAGTSFEMRSISFPGTFTQTTCEQQNVSTNCYSGPGQFIPPDICCAPVCSATVTGMPITTPLDFVDLGFLVSPFHLELY